MRTIALACSFFFGASLQAANNFVLVAHSGAGDYSKMTPEVIKARRDGMVKAIQAGFAVLRRGGASLDAVEATIRVMEDSGLYDAGRGAYYTKDGIPEMDAAITKAIAETSATSMKQMGAVVKAAKAVLEGKNVDGKALSDRVRARLS